MDNVIFVVDININMTKTILLIILFGLALILFFVLEVKSREHSPLDFISGYDKFEVRVGVDKNLGRYAGYHYEFKD